MFRRGSSRPRIAVGLHDVVRSRTERLETFVNLLLRAAKDISVPLRLQSVRAVRGGVEAAERLYWSRTCGRRAARGDKRGLQTNRGGKAGEQRVCKGVGTSTGGGEPAKVKEGVAR
ncbi:uncharacterized protein IUM83_19955 [Phytophthora cinnamomi]|uniref:uncharacterized protein n=1 Tax=Phytophthora cinnamomi TaxID=4785 RepID=UPI003559D38F|nr:hypothetical protein IUM83_19955 [Phytophthora cinnamomi]